MSIPIQRRFNRWATAIVVPHPQNGSSTRSPSRLLVFAELPAGGLLGRLRQAVLGRVSRGGEEYRRLLAEAGRVERHETLRSGFTDFAVLHLRTPDVRPSGV